MCLAVPMEIIKIDGYNAIAASRGVETPVNIALTPDVQIGDKVLIHARFHNRKAQPRSGKGNS